MYVKQQLSGGKLRLDSKMAIFGIKILGFQKVKEKKILQVVQWANLDWARLFWRD